MDQMDLNARAAYIRGMMNGMEFDAASKEGKVIAAMMDLLEQMAAVVTDHDDALDQVYDELETLDEDMDDLISFLAGDEGDGIEVSGMCRVCGDIGHGIGGSCQHKVPSFGGIDVYADLD